MRVYLEADLTHGLHAAGKHGFRVDGSLGAASTAHWSSLDADAERDALLRQTMLDDFRRAGASYAQTARAAARGVSASSASRSETLGSTDGSRTSEIAMTKRFQFQLRGATGSVTVSFQANEDPERWGYGTLGLTWPSELAKGLPVINAHTECSLEGYAATMGWIQIVRIDVLESSQPMAVGVERAPVGHHEWVDGPPHLRGLGVPFTSFGACPTLFDAPASTESDTTFFADSFLTASPDALISRTSFPILGIRWGYSTLAGGDTQASRAELARCKTLG